MKKFLLACVLLLCSVSLSGCQNMSNQDTGVIAGGIVGGLLGNTIGGGSGKIVATALGTVAGAVIGGSIGQSMDRADRMRVNEALDNNPLGEPAYWRNNRTHTRYRVTPVRNVKVGHNPYCREYRTVAIIDGKEQQMYGKACRQPDGSWKAVN